LIFVSARLVSSIYGACMNTTKRQPKSQRQPPRGRLSVALAALLFALLFSPLAKADAMKFADIKLGSVISEQIELPQLFGTHYFPLPPGDWGVQAIDADKSPGGIRTDSYYLTLTNQDPTAKMPVISVGPSLKTSGWNFRGCGPVDPAHGWYYVSGADMPTFPNEGKCANLQNVGKVTESRIDSKIKAVANSLRWTSVWKTVAAQPKLLDGKDIQKVNFNTAPWGGHWFDMAVYVELKKSDVAPENVVEPAVLNWIHLTADLLTQAAEGKKVTLTAFPAF